MANSLESRDIINSFRFYIMLSMFISKCSPYLKDKRLNEFKQELLDNGFTKETIAYYVHKASTSLPADFNNIMELQSVDYREKRTFIGKENY